MIRVNGTLHKSTELGRTNDRRHCDYCGLSNYWILMLYTSYFTFFSIPIFTYSKKIMLACPACDNELNTKENDELRSNITYF